MLDVQLRKLVLRGLLLLFTFNLAFFDVDLLKRIFLFDFKFFRTYHIVWLLLVVEMLRVCIPAFNSRLTRGKAFARYYRQPSQGYSMESLRDFTSRGNSGAIGAACIWAAFLIIEGFLYFAVFRSEIFIHLTVVLLYFCDQFAISVWCPFKAWVVRDKCCNTCRIYSWDLCMIFSPYIFLPSVWTWSLVCFSAAILVQWEYLHRKYPQRFSEISNANLKCSMCTNRICRNAFFKQPTNTGVHTHMGGT